jgi:putative oxygen-independent coproporphyrinogen III oxidase
LTASAPKAPTLPDAAPAAARPPARPSPPAGLYVHVPFCVSHCPYCDFVVLAGGEARGPANRIEAFTEALRVELELRADALDARFGPPGAGPGTRPWLDSLYLGGGTPSLLPADTVASLVELVRDRYGLITDAEVTLEVNPGPDERGDAPAQRAAGVTRHSIGAQSLIAAELRALGRRHAPADVGAAVRAARNAGVNSVGLDLLYDVPGQTQEAWSRTLDAALSLEPDHLSLYALTLDDPDADGLTGLVSDHLPVRPGARRWRDRARAAQDEDRAAAMYEHADRRLASAGFEWYELSNWARPGHRSRHNLAYWQGRPWEAVGPGAHAFDGDRRRWNAARLDGYLGALTPQDGSPPRLPPGGVAAGLTGQERDAETAILALRTREGVPDHALDRAAMQPGLTWSLGAGLLERTAQGRLALTLRGRLLSNEVFVRLA